LARRVKEGASVGNVRSFLAGVACNVVKEQLRVRARVDVHQHQSVADTQSNHSKVMVRLEDRKLLLASLRRLAVDDQIILALRYWAEFGTRDIAEILGANPSTVRTRLQRAEGKLRKLVETLAESGEAQQGTTSSLTGWARGMCARAGG
jgi:RNA polymerase sigma factor (sigma-70 family)